MNIEDIAIKIDGYVSKFRMFWDGLNQREDILPITREAYDKLLNEYLAVKKEVWDYLHLTEMGAAPLVVLAFMAVATALVGVISYAYIKAKELELVKEIPDDQRVEIIKGMYFDTKSKWTDKVVLALAAIGGYKLLKEGL